METKMAVTSTAYRPLVAIPMGDPAGIGPEIVVRALLRPETYQVCKPLVIGTRVLIEDILRVIGVNNEIVTVLDPRKGKYQYGSIDLASLDNISSKSFRYGKVNAVCGKAFVEYIKLSAEWALSGAVDAVACAPTNKESMRAAGYDYSGQTDIYAEISKTTDYFTILTGGLMRIFLVSSHVSLRQAIDLITPGRIESVLRMARSSLYDLWKIDSPNIGGAGLNPHAGDGGLFGIEEQDVVIPVIEKLRQEGFHIDGPISADALYNNADKGRYDGVIGMYHDQGVIPLKRYGYVTVIAGTPMIRTTAGHGTAYDIAGKGIADDSVMARAIRVAAELASLRTLGKTTT
jgi:4-hydroxythreonine-4-phosphate dehydrogenase